MPFHSYRDAEGVEHHLGATGPRHFTNRFGGKIASLDPSKIKDGSIEAGLLCLSAWLSEHPGIRLSRAEIAYVCGCSDTLIFNIEQSAFRALRKRHPRALRAHQEEL